MMEAPAVNTLPKLAIKDGSEWPSQEPGLYAGVEEEAYHATRACSNSQISVLQTEPPETLKWKLEHPEEYNTPAREFGRRAHACILEPHRFDEQFDKARTCNATTQSTGERCMKSGSLRIRGKWYCRTSGHAPNAPMDDVTAIREADYDQLIAMRKRCEDHEMIGRVLVLPSYRELSALWIDEATGLLCKMRIDLYAHEAAFLLDYKTFRKALTEENMAWEIHNRGYHRQAVMYLSGCKALGVPLDDYAIIFQQKSGPYYARLCRIDEAALRVGAVQARELMQIYAETVAQDHFPGYDDGVDILPIGLPDKILDYGLTDGERSAILTKGNITL